MDAAEAERARLNLPGAAFAVYWLLHREDVPGARQAAERMDTVFQQYPHWQVSERQGRAVRAQLYKVLLQGQAADKAKGATKEPGLGYDVKSMVEQILKAVERAEG